MLRKREGPFSNRSDEKEEEDRRGKGELVCGFFDFIVAASGSVCLALVVARASAAEYEWRGSLVEGRIQICPVFPLHASSCLAR
jgi:hypothetical protein